MRSLLSFTFRVIPKRKEVLDIFFVILKLELKMEIKRLTKKLINYL